MRRRNKIAISFAVMLTLAYGVKSCHDSVCGYDPQDEVSIPDSLWTVYARVYRCSSLDGASDVVAINRTTKKEIPIISFWDIERIKLRATNSTRLTVELNNDVYIKELHDSFDGIAIVYKYHPDDPEARAFFQLSHEKPNDPRVQKTLFANKPNP